jgi:hypothetical protein
MLSQLLSLFRRPSPGSLPRRPRFRLLTFEACESRSLLSAISAPNLASQTVIDRSHVTSTPSALDSYWCCSAAEGEAGQSAYAFSLTGNLPARLQITDPSDGTTVFDGQVNSQTFDASFLPIGDYIFWQTSPGEIPRSTGVTVDWTGLTSYSTHLNIPGNHFPQRVRITDEASGQLVRDSWIYGSAVDVVGMLPAGNYALQHAGSGEDWQSGRLWVGAKVPAFRVYTEPQTDNVLLVDWGPLGLQSSARVQVDQYRTSIHDQNQNGSQVTVPNIPLGDVKVRVSVPGHPTEEFALSITVPRTSRITLPGSLPRSVQIVDTQNGQVVFERQVDQPTLQLGFLADGNYLVRHFSSADSVHTIAVSKDKAGVFVSSTLLTLDGPFPRRVRITDIPSGSVVWDHWIYGGTLDVVGMLPTGDYSLQHASSGEHWRFGRLRIGGRLPSQRLYVEDQADQALLVDWGPLGTHSSIRTRVDWQGTTLIDASQPGTEAQFQVQPGAIAVQVELPGLATESVTISSTIRNKNKILLPGTVPRQVRITETATGTVMFAGESATEVVDLSYLPYGDYLVQVAAPGEWPRSKSISIAAAGVLEGDTSLTLHGVLPRRVRITSASTNLVVWDHWIYDSSLTVLEMLGPGSYLVEHAASGENWRRGELRIGEPLPSNRLYTEFLDSGMSRVDWGFLGHHPQVHVIGLLGGQTVLDFDSSATQTTVAVPDRLVRFRVTPAPVLDQPVNSRWVALPGSSPRHVRVIDPATDLTVLERDISDNRLDLAALTFGSYVIEHAAVEEMPSHLTAFHGLAATDVFDPVLELDGEFPRRLVITDLITQQVVWDQWHYGSTTYVLGMVPAGEYTLQHAAPGESWRQGKLVVGSHLPSYRLYTEQISPTMLSIDWGPVGPDSAARVQVFANSLPITDTTYRTGRTTIEVPSADLTIRVTVGTEFEHATQHCSIPVVALDGSCRSFTESVSASLVRGSLFGFVLSGVYANTVDAGNRIRLVEPPRHGTLRTGDSLQFQTYVPNLPFEGRDSAVFRIRQTDGSESTVLVVFDVIAPVVPDFAYYVPGTGTTPPDYRIPNAARLVGPAFPLPVIVNSDFGQVVERIQPDGTTAWRHVQPSPTSTVAVLNNSEIFVAGAREVRVLDGASGALRRTIPISLPEGSALQFANPLDAHRILLSWFTATDISFIGIWNSQQGWEWNSPQPYLWPRWAELSGNFLAVADTYNNRVVVQSFPSGRIITEIPAYFPNDVRFVNAFKLLITEEHSDRIWLYDLLTRKKILVISAPGPRSDLSLPFSTVEQLSNSVDLRMIPTSSSSFSKASTRSAGKNTVYAPNGAVRLPNGSYYIADSDNHRVIHVSSQGIVLSELVGLNNPTKVAYLP